MSPEQGRYINSYIPVASQGMLGHACFVLPWLGGQLIHPCGFSRDHKTISVLFHYGGGGNRTSLSLPNEHRTIPVLCHHMGNYYIPVASQGYQNIPVLCHHTGNYYIPVSFQGRQNIPVLFNKQPDPLTDIFSGQMRSKSSNQSGWAPAARRDK